MIQKQDSLKTEKQVCITTDRTTNRGTKGGTNERTDEKTDDCVDDGPEYVTYHIYLYTL